MYVITGIVGLVLAFAPFLFGYSSDTPALLTSLLVGGFVIFMSLLEGLASDRDRWEYWVAGALGIGTAFAPFLFGFAANAPAVTTSVILGTILAFIAGSKLTTGVQT